MKSQPSLKNTRTQTAAILFLICFLANPAFSEDATSHFSSQSTLEARIAVEKAWEVYHHAALGGTLASPSIQSHLESNLHKSRALLAEAYEAENQGNEKTTQALVAKILSIANTVIAGSQESKK